MKKIRLDIDALHVDSFATDRQARGQGTVQGYASQYPCTVYDTCDAGCGGGGGGSGYNTCGTANTCGLCHSDLDNCDTSYKHCGGAG